MREIKLRGTSKSTFYVTSDGRVFQGNREMHYHIAHGYRRVRIKDTSTGVRRYYRVSRLVAEAYIPNPNNLPIVNHIDGNKQNDVVANLEWCTVAENTQHAYDNDLIKDRGGWKSTPHHLRQANLETA